MRILLDAGHGGHDPGAVSAGFEEEDITLDVVLTLGERLSRKWQVRYIRQDDTYMSPGRRLQLIREYQPDCFVSIHCNASDKTSAHGIEVLWKDEYDKRLAETIQKSLLHYLGLRDRGIKRVGSPEYPRNLSVLQDLKTPAVLVEIGFITNDHDREVIQKIELVAEAIEEGIIAWERGLS